MLRMVSDPARYRATHEGSAAAKRSQSGGLSPPWPVAEDAPLTIAGDNERAGMPWYAGRREAARPRHTPADDRSGATYGIAAMSSDQRSAEYDEQLARERMAQLAEADALLSLALTILDDHSRSAAAATVDLAIHHLRAELAG